MSGRPEIVARNEVLPLDPEQLKCGELRYAVRHAPRSGRCYGVRAEHGATDQKEELEVVFFPDAGRAGIAWKEEVWWLDAESPEDAVQRWAAGEGRTTPSRDRLVARQEETMEHRQSLH